MSIVLSVRGWLDLVRIQLIMVQAKFSMSLVHLLFNSDPGDLELIMMHKAYLEEEINKLLQYPEYGQVLFLWNLLKKRVYLQRREESRQRGGITNCLQYQSLLTSGWSQSQG